MSASPTKPPIEQRDERILIRLRVQPKASRNAISIEPDGRIRIALTAPPVDGTANKALRAFIAKRLRIPKASVELTQGEKSRDKVIAVSGITLNEVTQQFVQNAKPKT